MRSCTSDTLQIHDSLHMQLAQKEAALGRTRMAVERTSHLASQAQAQVVRLKADLADEKERADALPEGAVPNDIQQRRGAPARRPTRTPCHPHATLCPCAPSAANCMLMLEMPREAAAALARRCRAPVAVFVD